MSRKEATVRRPGERADLSYGEVIDAAVVVYRQAGAGALSMRSVARHLGIAPNALYSHVRDKDDLVAGLIDALLGEIEQDASVRDWKDGIFQLMVSSRTVLLKYGDLMPFLLGQATRGANAMRLGEKSLEYLSLAGLNSEQSVEALQILLVYTVGFAAQAYPRATDPDARDRRSQSRKAFGGADLPLTSAAATLLAEYPSERSYETGLRWLIDGIATRAGGGRRAK